MLKQQRGGTIIGFILGVIVGLGVALGVAVYVTKVPVPFLNKADQRGNAASEAERNRNWDPNSSLYGSTPARPASAVHPGVAPSPVVTPMPGVTGVTPAGASNDPLGDLANAQLRAAQAKAQAAANAEAAASSGATPGGAAAGPNVGADGFSYFVQAGAFRTQNDADAQKARLAMMGWEARISEREQNGRPVFRVRVGPFAKRSDAEQLKQKFDAAGVDSALVRVQQ